MSEKKYLILAKKLLMEGNVKDDRTGVGTYSLFGQQLRFDLKKGFPLLTTKRVPFSLIKSELLWFLHGDTNIRYLLENKNHIWDEWAFAKFVKSSDYTGIDMTDFGIRSSSDPEFKKVLDQEMKKFTQRIIDDSDFAKKYGDLGNIYGKQWRNWETPDGRVIDQLQQVIEQIKYNPDSRRMIVSSWNPSDIPTMALPPCHTLFQFYVANGKLSLQLYQRSGDFFLGVPFNIASYALLVYLVANVTNLKVGELIMDFGDLHVYRNHVKQVKEQLQNQIMPFPNLKINPDINNIDDYNLDDIELLHYRCAGRISAPVAV